MNTARILFLVLLAAAFVGAVVAACPPDNANDGCSMQAGAPNRLCDSIGKADFKVDGKNAGHVKRQAYLQQKLAREQDAKLVSLENELQGVESVNACQTSVRNAVATFTPRTDNVHSSPAAKTLNKVWTDKTDGNGNGLQAWPNEKPYFAELRQIEKRALDTCPAEHQKATDWLGEVRAAQTALRQKYKDMLVAACGEDVTPLRGAKVSLETYVSGLNDKIDAWTTGVAAAKTAMQRAATGVRGKLDNKRAEHSKHLVAQANAAAPVRAAMFTVIAPCQMTQAAMFEFAVHPHMEAHSVLGADFPGETAEAGNGLDVVYTDDGDGSSLNGIGKWRSAFVTWATAVAAATNQQIGNLLGGYGSANERNTIKAAFAHGNVVFSEDMTLSAKFGNNPSQQFKNAVDAVGTAALAQCKNNLAARKPNPAGISVHKQTSWGLPGAATNNANHEVACAVACAMALARINDKIKSCSVAAFTVHDRAQNTNTDGHLLAISGGPNKPNFVPNNEWVNAASTPDGQQGRGPIRSFSGEPHKSDKVFRTGFRRLTNAFPAPQNRNDYKFPEENGAKGSCSEDKILVDTMTAQDVVLTNGLAALK